MVTQAMQTELLITLNVSKEHHLIGDRSKVSYTAGLTSTSNREMEHQCSLLPCHVPNTTGRTEWKSYRVDSKKWEKARIILGESSLAPRNTHVTTVLKVFYGFQRPGAFRQPCWWAVQMRTTIHQTSASGRSIP